MPSGRAPVMLTLRVASATDIWAPRYGSTALTDWLPSVVATRAFVVPLPRITAAPWPGHSTVLLWTDESYCSYTQRRLARLGLPRRATSTAAGSMPRSGRPSWHEVG